MRRTLMVAILAVGLLAALASTAVAAPPENNNALRSQAEQVELDADDVGEATIEGTDYVTVEHDLEYDNYVWCEPARRGGNADCTVTEVDEGFDTAYFGVAGPDGEAIHHKGPVSVYYETDEGWQEIRAQFNGKGELVKVNGVRP